MVGLWLAATICYLYGDYFELYTPGKVNRLAGGTDVLDTPWALLAAAVVMTLPVLGVVAALLARAPLARWVNVVVGALFTLLMVAIGLGSLAEWYAFYVYLAAVEAVLTGTVVVLAWRWRVGSMG